MTETGREKPKLLPKCPGINRNNPRWQRTRGAEVAQTVAEAQQVMEAEAELLGPAKEMVEVIGPVAERETKADRIIRVAKMCSVT